MQNNEATSSTSTKSKKSPKPPSQKRISYRWLTQQSVSARSWLSLSIFLSIFSGVLIISQAAILAMIIDHVYLHHATLPQMRNALWLLVAITICRGIAAWTREITGFKAADTIKTKVRLSLLKSLLTLNPDEISRKKTGALTTKLIENIEALQGFFSDYLPQMTIVIVLPCIILILVFMENWVAGCVLLITAPLIPLFMALIGMGVESLNQRHFKSLARLGSHFLDLLQGLTTLSLFNRARAQTETIHQQSNNYRIKTMRVLQIAFLSSAVLELFSTVAIAMIAVYLGLGLLGLVHIGFGQHQPSLQSAFFILLLAPEFFMPLRQLGTFYHARAEAIAAATAILKLSTATQHPKKNAETITNKLNSITLSCQALTFAYPNKPPVIQNLSFEVPAGSYTVITGPSGTGKSTLLKLIAALQIPNSGNLFANHINLADIDRDSWHNQISFLAQTPYLFHDSIAKNIALANPQASFDMINQAARDAEVLSFAKTLPNGLDTLIGEQYLGLSGGQAQRVALARAYLKDAPLVLFDEPTAHLDAENKTAILRTIEQWHGNKTIIIATHDQALIQHADTVITLKPNE